MAAKVTASAAGFEVGSTERLFSTRPKITLNPYDVSPDGQRFLVNTLTEEATEVTVVVNWPALLNK